MIHAAHGTLLHVGVRRLATVHGDLDVHVFRNLFTRTTVLAAAHGRLGGAAPLLARVHSSCVTSEAYGSRDCDCAEQLDTALAQIVHAGRGVIFYLAQEGRGAGFAAKARDRMLVQASRDRLTTFDAYARLGLERDHRTYDEVGFMRQLLGVSAPLVLMTSNPEKAAEIAASGVPVAGTVALAPEASPFNVHYLSAKGRARAVGAGEGGETRAATLPEPVAALAPEASLDAPHLVRMASYLLPIAVPRPEAGGWEEPRWFRLHAYFDAAAGCDRVVLTYGRPGATAPLVRVQRERLLERFPLVGGGEEKRRWHATVRAFVEQGAGCAVLRVADDCEDGAVAPPDAAACLLLARHAGARRVRPLLDGSGAAEGEGGLCRALARHGIDTDPPRML